MYKIMKCFYFHLSSIKYGMFLTYHLNSAIKGPILLATVYKYLNIKVNIIKSKKK